MAITQKFVKEHNKQYFVVYTISKETINNYFEENEADAGQKQEAFSKFEGLRDFLISIFMLSVVSVNTELVNAEQ